MVSFWLAPMMTLKSSPNLYAPPIPTNMTTIDKAPYKVLPREISSPGYSLPHDQLEQPH